MTLLPLAPSRTSGFTLVELSIVMVIIGLIVGGVMVGKELIHTAEVKSQIQQIADYQTAVRTFYMKNSGLPGDIANATQIFSSTEWPLVTNGNGDGQIRDSIQGKTYFTGEIAQFFMQLSAAKMIKGQYTTTATLGVGWPTLELGRNGLIAVHSDTYDANIFYLGIKSLVDPGVNNNMLAENSLVAEEAWQMDSKVDDGHPVLGVIRARGSSGATFNIDPDYYDTFTQWEPNHVLPISLSLLTDWLISPSYAGTAALATPDACIFVDYDGSSYTSQDNVINHAVYALPTIKANCQLAIRFDPL